MCESGTRSVKLYNSDGTYALGLDLAGEVKMSSPTSEGGDVLDVAFIEDLSEWTRNKGGVRRRRRRRMAL